ncbi:hypothetical protein ACQKLP_14565 [Chitinophaga sp. NPDC101104]|uniref:hypothetical protein n=1 Tax=Chitinophaga sp. NPDC101104 TaxID=3390561 RepID=UPI003D01FF56
MEEKLAHKLLLKQCCEQVILQRIAISRRAMDEAQAAANQEDKSSAGDKYETSRAMGHLEKDMHARQLVAHQQELAALRAVNVQAICLVPAAGAFVRSANAGFFIGAGLGKQTINGETVIFLSPASPLARQLMRMKVGDTFDFKGKEIILEIY